MYLQFTIKTASQISRAKMGFLIMVLEQQYLENNKKIRVMLYPIYKSKHQWIKHLINRENETIQVLEENMANSSLTRG